MKKLNLIGIGCYLLLLVAGEKADAQNRKAASVGPLMIVNTKAMRNFVKSYESAVDPEWVSLKDGGYLCRFVIDNVRCRAFYGEKGAWLLTLASYEENKLPRDIRAIVRNSYYDHTITYVDEISVPGRSKIYLVQIQDDKGIKMLRVSDGEMETVRELVKLQAR